MDFKQLEEIIDRYRELEEYGYSLANALVKDGNNSYEDCDKFFNAKNRVETIESYIDIILERLWTLGDYYDLLYDMETEKDKFLVLKKINNQKESISNKLDYAIKYIREVNLIDYRVIDFGRDFKAVIESTSMFLRNL